VDESERKRAEITKSLSGIPERLRPTHPGRAAKHGAVRYPALCGVSWAELRRQDSNLNCLNQNQKCCRLHHDGSLRPAVKTASTLDDRAGRSWTATRG
jgi:hypothetical protein